MRNPQTGARCLTIKQRTQHFWLCDLNNQRTIRKSRYADDAVTRNAGRCRIRSGHGSENLSGLKRPTTSLILGHGEPVVSMIRDLNRNP